MLADDELRAALTTRLPDLQPQVEAELDRLLARAHAVARRRRTASVAGLVAAAVLAVGLAFVHDWRPDATQPEPVDETPVRAVFLEARGQYARPAPLDPGRYRSRPLGPIVRGPTLELDLDIPAGWGHDDIYAFATGPGDDRATRRIDVFADVRRVTVTQCEAGHLIRPGPTALDLANALTALGGTSASAPMPATLDGYAGYLFRVDDSGSGVVPCGAGFVLRESSYSGVVMVHGDDRGWTNLVWILDVENTRVVINASHGPDVTSVEEAELVEIVESISFVVP